MARAAHLTPTLSPSSSPPSEGEGRVRGGFARLRPLIRYVRVSGLRRALASGFESYVFAYRRWYIFYRQIAGPVVSPADDEFRCRLATLDDLDRLTVFEPYRRRSEFRDWLEDKACWIFVTLDGDRPVAFQCLSRVPPSSPMFSSVTLARDQVWTVDSYTLPEYRRRHVATRLKAFRRCLLHEWGYREMVATVREDNLPTLAYAYDRTVRQVQRLAYLRLLWFSRTRVEEDAGATLEARLSRAGVLRGRGPEPMGERTAPGNRVFEKVK